MPVDPLIDPPLETPAEPPAKTRYGMHWSAAVVCALLALAHLAVFMIYAFSGGSDTGAAAERLGFAIGGMTISFLISIFFSIVAFYLAGRSRRLATVVFIIVIVLFGLDSLAKQVVGDRSGRAKRVHLAYTNFYDRAKAVSAEYDVVVERFKAAGAMNFARLNTPAEQDAMLEILQDLEKSNKELLGYVNDGENRLMVELAAAGANREEQDMARSEFRTVFLANGETARATIQDELELMARYHAMLSELRSIEGKWRWDAMQRVILYDKDVPDDLIARQNEFQEWLAARRAKREQAAPGAAGPPGK